MGLRLLQGNMNHFRRTQDLFLHTLAESGSSVDIVAEPDSVPHDHPCWANDECSSVAITW